MNKQLMENDTKQVKIKTYGIISFTKTDYLKVQALVFVILAITFIFFLLWQMPGELQGNIFFDNILIILLIVAFLETLEMLFMLKKFEKKEKEIKNNT